MSLAEKTPCLPMGNQGSVKLGSYFAKGYDQTPSPPAPFTFERAAGHKPHPRSPKGEGVAVSGPGYRSSFNISRFVTERLSLLWGSINRNTVDK